MKTYYTYDRGAKRLSPAPRAIKTDTAFIVNPTAAQYAATGAYPLGEPLPPEPPEGKVAVPDGYELADGKWRQVYRYDDTPAPTLADYDAAMEGHLRKEREARGYTTREPDAYLTSGVPRWAADATDWVAHRDEVMQYAQDLANAVAAGTREPPTMAEFLAGLPRIEWTFAGA